MGLDEVLASAARLDWSQLGERALCDPCLGRLLGKAGHGFTNAERGRAIRDAHGIPRGGACWLCAGLLDEVPKFAQLIAAKLEPWEFRTFLVGSKVDRDVEEREQVLWVQLGTAQGEPVKNEINREVGKRVAGTTGVEADLHHPDIAAIVDTAYDVVELEVTPLFLYGRYRKLSRDIPQTRWPCKRCRGKGCDHCGGKGKMYETSVEEIVAAEIMKQSGGTGHALHGMGREDVDALMLGNGRPFVVEISRPRRRTVQLPTVEEAVNRSGLVEVEGLRPSSRDEVIAVKEDRADKTYRVRVRLSAEIDPAKLKEGVRALAGMRIAQRTPTRVSHRRADLVRDRVVRGVEVLRSDGREAELLVTAEAGTYVKEALHGDAGRTEPSLAGILGVPCEVLELDVVRIHDTR
ncbi:MAG TPA: tRNA pseudouridine(54/55) synthase Pus10 [Thermoplasmata archaeon]|jgi:tRNA pseudouridine synthase 10|nr:tRNA pseudouridine(54/55) synthase Pus10 [Thermoplasmata archaeon]